MALANAAILTITNNVDGLNLTLSGAGTLASRNVGVRPIIDFSGFALGGSAAGNYTLAGATGSVLITSATLHYARRRHEVYDATTGSTAVPTVLGLFAPDTVTGLSQAFNSRHAGSRTISVAGYTVNDGNGGANYAVSASGVALGTINRRPLSIAVQSETKPYDGTATSSLSPLVTGLAGADAVFLRLPGEFGGVTTLSQIFNSRNAGSRTLIMPGTYLVSDRANGGNYIVTVTATAPEPSTSAP